jgi:hypothetical protein
MSVSGCKKEAIERTVTYGVVFGLRTFRLNWSEITLCAIFSTRVVFRSRDGFVTCLFCITVWACTLRFFPQNRVVWWEEGRAEEYSKLHCCGARIQPFDTLLAIDLRVPCVS